MLLLIVVEAAAVVGGLMLVNGAGAPIEPEPAAEAPAPPPPPALPTTYEVRVSAIPASAEVIFDGAPAGHGSLERTLARDGAVHVIELRARGHVPQRIELQDITTVAEIVLERAPRGHRTEIAPRVRRVTEQGLVDVQPTEH